MNREKVWLRRIEIALLVVGLLLVTVFVTVKVHSRISARIALEKFEQERSASQREASDSIKLQTGRDVDTSLWSEFRVKGYLESLASKTDAPPAVLRIPKLHLEVPIFDGTDELTLNRGAGRIIGTARLGELGNTGIAGHRDGFFRGLKDIGPGDTLELLLPHRTDRYVVTNILITDPDDVSVLQPSSIASLTLVTCYPFYFVGSAPRRYIVQATSDDSALLNGEPINPLQPR
jgi:sortase A